MSTALLKQVSRSEQNFVSLHAHEKMRLKHDFCSYCRQFIDRGAYFGWL